MSMDSRSQVERYLAEVDAALAASGSADRADIVAGLREHIFEASSVDGGQSLAEVLRDVGDPQLIAASAAARDEEATRRQHQRLPATGETWFAVVSLALVFFGALLGVFGGWLVLAAVVWVGLVMMWWSRAWTTAEKLKGTLLVPAPGIAIWIVLGFAVSAQVCVTSVSGTDTQTVCEGGGAGPVVGIAVTIAAVAVILAGVVTTIRLFRRATAQ